MKRKLLSVLLVLVLCAGLMPAVVLAAEPVANGTCGEDVDWALDSEGTLTISGTGPMGDYSGTYATSNYGPYHDDIEAVVIEPGVTRIGSAAFYRQDSSYNPVVFSNLKSVQIPDTVQSIGGIAFYKTVFEEITIPYGLERIDNQAFEYSGIKSIVLPDSVTSVNYLAFAGCKSLETVTLSDRLTQLTGSLFSGCDKLTSVTFHGVLDSMAGSVFYNCSSLESLELTIRGKNASLGDDIFKNVPAGEVTIYGEAGGTVESEASTKNYTFATAQNNFTFDANGGSGEMAGLSVTFDGSDYGNFPACAFTNGDLLFIGWNTKADGTGTSVSDQSEVRLIGANGNVTLYAQWGNSITVGDGTATNSYVPLYRYYNYGKSQAVVSASELSALSGTEITGLSYYPTGTSKNAMIAVYLTETSLDSLTEFIAVPDSDEVFSGSVEFDVETETHLVFNTPFAYSGGNLLITVINNTGNYSSGLSFYGVNRTGASRSAVSDGTQFNAGYTGSSVARDFLPKMTFTKGDTIVTSYDLYIAGTRVTSENADDLSAIDGVTGAASYDAQTNTLTLNGATIVNGGTGNSSGADRAGIYSASTDPLNIVVTDTNSVTGRAVEDATTYGIYANGALVLSGTGSLNVLGSATGNSVHSYGVYTKGNLSVLESCTLDVLSGKAYSSYSGDFAHSVGAQVEGGLITLGGNASVTLTGERGGYSSSGLYLENSSVQFEPESGWSGSFTVQSTGSGFAGAMIGWTGLSFRFNSDRTEMTAYDSLESTTGTVMTQNSYEFSLSSDNTLTAYPKVVITPHAVAIAPVEFTVTPPKAGEKVSINGNSVDYEVEGTDYVIVCDPYAENVSDLENCTYFEGAFEKNADYYSRALVIPADGTALTALTANDVTINGAEFVSASVNDYGEGYVYFKVAVSEDAEVIEEVNITVTIPTDGDAYYEPEAGTSDQNYEICSSVWLDGEGEIPDEFKAAEEYYLDLLLRPAKGYIFGETVAARLSGTSAVEVDVEETLNFDEILVPVTVKNKPNPGGGGGGSTPEEPEEEPFPFVDVPEDAFFRKAVEWALKEGVTGGTTPETFSPYALATRAQMITFLWAAKGCPEPKADVTVFYDVDPDAYYFKALSWAYYEDIVAGLEPHIFGPDVTVTRAQAATFLYGVAGRPETGTEPFGDVNDGDYFQAPVAWAYGEGITSGTSDTTFSPYADCLRGQIITFLYLFFGAE